MERLEPRLLLSQGRVAEAEETCRGALASDPRNPELLLLLGQSLIAQNRFQEAAEAFLRGASFAPFNPALPFFAGVSLQGVGRHEEAVPLIVKAIELEPGQAQFHGKLGHLMVLLGRPREAIAPLRRAIELNPAFVPAQLFLAGALMGIGEYAEARAVLDGVSEIAPDNAEVCLIAGRMHQQQGNFEKAAAQFQRAIQLEPEAPAAYVSLAYSQKFTEKDASLIKKIEILANLERLPDEDRSLLHYALGKAYDDLASYEKATGQFDEANRSCRKTRRARGEGFDRSAHAAYLERVHRFFAENQCESPSESDRPIFIVGMVRSGTTLVEQILASHPEVAPAGELRFWIERFAGLTDEYAASIQERFGAAIREYESAMQGVSATAARITDKMPINYQVLGAILRSFPRARIVHCVRDAVDNCLSIYTTPFFDPPDFAHARSDIVFAYREYERAMARWKGSFPDARILEVRYEELTSNPERCIRELISFAGLEWDDRCLEPSKADNPVNTPSFWQVRQPIYERSAGRWRNYEPWLGAFRDLLNVAP